MAARHRVTAGRHLGAGRLVRLTQDFFVYNNPCLSGNCNDGPTCDNNDPDNCCNRILEGTGQGGIDNTKSAEDVRFADGLAAFSQTNGGVEFDNFFGIGAINLLVPSHTQIFSENRNTHNDAAGEHAPVMNISHNLSYARYRKGMRVHTPMPNVNYSAVKSIIGTTPAMSMGTSSGFINSLGTVNNSGGIDHAFDNITPDLVEDVSSATVDPRKQAELNYGGRPADEAMGNGDGTNTNGDEESQQAFPCNSDECCRNICATPCILAQGVACGNGCQAMAVCGNGQDACCAAPNPCDFIDCPEDCKCFVIGQNTCDDPGYATCVCDPDPCEHCSDCPLGCGCDEDCNCIAPIDCDCICEGEVCSTTQVCPGSPCPSCPSCAECGGCPGSDPDPCPPPCGGDPCVEDGCIDACTECPGCPDEDGECEKKDNCGVCGGKGCDPRKNDCCIEGGGGCEPCPPCPDSRSAVIKSGVLTSVKGNYQGKDIVPIGYFKHDLNAGLDFGTDEQLAVGPRDTVMSCVLELTVADVFGRLPYTGGTPYVKPLKISVYKSKQTIDTSTVNCNRYSTGNDWTLDAGRHASDRELVASSTITVGDTVAPLDKIHLDLTNIARDAAQNNNGVMNFMVEASEWFDESTGLKAAPLNEQPAMLLKFYRDGVNRPKIRTNVNQGLRPSTSRLNPAVMRRRAITAGL